MKSVNSYPLVTSLLLTAQHCYKFEFSWYHGLSLYQRLKFNNFSLTDQELITNSKSISVWGCLFSLALTEVEELPFCSRHIFRISYLTVTVLYIKAVFFFYQAIILIIQTQKQPVLLDPERHWAVNVKTQGLMY